jgi:UTP--glucose-1-phosphate uridylyltransferase
MMKAEGENQFGQLLRQAREIAGLSRDRLAQRVELDASYIYRIEIGDRRPSREAALVLAEALGVDGEDLNKWLMAAGYAPMPLLTAVRGAVRTRGGRRRPSAESTHSFGWDAARWAEWLEAMGLQEVMIRRLLKGMETAGLTERQQIARMVSNTFSRVAEILEAPVHTAVIPAAGGHHRLVAPHVMQHLLLQALAEATESGISEVILVLAPGMIDSLYTPLKEALELAVAPSIKLQFAEQARPEGLGDAILQAEELVGKEPFAVLLPDDVVQERIGRTAYPRELRRMMEAFSQLDGAYLVAVAPVPKSKLPQYGVAKVGSKEVIPNILPIIQLIEKPIPSHPIFHSTRTFGIVGRYLLRPDIFRPLRELREKGIRPVQLTVALEHLRQTGQSIYAFGLKAARQDIGEVLGQASELIGASSESLRAEQTG